MYSEILPFNTPVDDDPREAAGRASSCRAGPKSVSERDAPKCDPRVLELGLPTLGICYGMQLMTDMLGGQVAPSPHREFGFAAVTVARRHDAAAVPRAAGRSARVGEPRRLRRRRAAGVCGRGDQRERAGRRDGSARARLLRAAVPSRGRAHRTRQGNPPELRVRRLRLHRRLDDRVVHRRVDRPHPRSRSATAASSARCRAASIRRSPRR